jgi:hypothetical protein
VRLGFGAGFAISRFSNTAGDENKKNACWDDQQQTAAVTTEREGVSFAPEKPLAFRT